MIIVVDQYNKQKTILTNNIPKAPQYFRDNHYESLDGVLTYEFEVRADSKATTHLVAGNSVLVRDLDKRLMKFTILRTSESQSGGQYVRRIFCENSAVGDLIGHVVTGKLLSATNPKQAGTYVLSGTGWEVGEVDFVGIADVDLRDFPTGLAGLHKIREVFGLELEFTIYWNGQRIVSQLVHFVKRRGRRTGKRFTVGKDLNGISRTEDRSDMCTAIVPIGKADEEGNRLTLAGHNGSFEGWVSPPDQNWIGDNQALQQFGVAGKHIFGRVEFSSVDNVYELMKVGVAEIKKRNKPRMTYELTVLLLERLAKFKDTEKVRLGDYVLIKDTHFEPYLAVDARVIAINRSYTDPSKDNVVMGEFMPVIIEPNKQIEAIQSQINNNMSKWEAKGETVYKSNTPPVESKRTPDMLWLDTSREPNIMKRWDVDAKVWVKATATEASEVGAETPDGATAKAKEAEEKAIETAEKDATQKKAEAILEANDYTNEVIVEAMEETIIKTKSYVDGLVPEIEAELQKHADAVAKDAEDNAKLYTEQYSEKALHVDSKPPVDTTKLWMDTTKRPFVLKKYDGKEWIPASPQVPADIGAPDIKEVMEKANEARDSAITEAKKDAETKADKARQDAIAEAKKLDEAVKSEAERIAKEAEKNANAHTSEVTKLVEEALKQDSQDKANTAEKNAVDKALQDAKKLAEQAETNSKNHANTIRTELNAGIADARKHAETKASEAQTNATNRANDVKKEVEAFAKNAGNITEGTLAAQRLHGVTISGKSAKIVDIDAGNITVGMLDASRLKVGSISAELLEFGGRLRNVAGNAKTEYSTGDLIANGMTGTDNTAVPRWMIKQYPATATIDLTTIVGEVSRIGFTTYYTTDARYTPKSFKIETSLNGTAWEVVADVTDNTVSPLSYTFGGRQVRYIRMTVREPQAGQTNVNIANFEVMATQGGSILTGDSILTGRIDATKVNVDNLNAGNIKSGTLHADRIGADSINATKIQSGAITTEKLHVLAKSLVANTSLTGNDSTGWNISKHASSTVALRSSGNMGDVLVHGFTTADHDTPTLYNSNPFEVDPNQTYKFSIGMFLDKNNRDASQYFGFTAYDKNMVELPVYFVNPNGTNIDPTERKNPYFWSGKDVSGSWRMMDGYVMSSQGQANECPAGRNVHQNFKMHPATKFLRMRFYSGYYPTKKNQAMEVLWHSPSVTAVDSGTFVAEKIVAGTLDANKVNVTNLKANNITSGTMTADRINGGTINATNTNIINIKAGNITSGTIDASKINVINMNAGNISTGMLNVGGTQIAKGTDFMRKDWKPLRASVAYSINENYLITGGAQAKEEFVYLPRFDLNGGGGEKVTLAFEYNVDANYVALPEIFLLASKSTTEALIDSVNHDYVHVLTGGESPVDIGGGWKRVTKTFTIQNDIKSAVLRLDHNGSKDGKACNYRYRRVMLNYGNIALTWSPHTEESIGIGAITADKIRAGAITTNKLTVGDFTNLVPNSAFINGTMEDWDRGNVVGSASAGVPAGAPTQYVRTQTERDTYAGDWFAVKTGDRFYCELTAATANSGVPISLGLHYVDKDNNPYWTVFTPRISPTGGKWVTQGGEIHISVANATKAKVFMQVDGTTGSVFGTWYMTNAKIHRKTDADLIVDGSVIASKIATNAVTADKIVAGAINASKISANAIDASKIASNAVTTDKLSANAVNASKIQAGAITADKIATNAISASMIQTGTLDASKVTINNLTANRITGGTMSADRISGGTINASTTNIINMKAQNIASGTINADNVEISNGRVTIGKEGVQVTEADFLVKDARTGFTHSMQSQTNLIADHSFELLTTTGSGLSNEIYMPIDPSYINKNPLDGWMTVGTPYITDGYTIDTPDDASAYGRKAVRCNTNNYVWTDFRAKGGRHYTISFHVSKPYHLNSSASPQVQVEYVKNGSVISSEVKNFAQPSTPVGQYVRYGFTVTAPTTLNHERDNRIRLRFRANNYDFLLYDGIQAVQGDRAVPYDSEDSLFLMSNNRLTPVQMSLRNLMMQGNTRIEGGGLSIAGRNMNGVGLEMSERLRIWGDNPIEVRQSHVEAYAFRCIGSRPEPGTDRMIWAGWHDSRGNGIYVHIGGSWKLAVQL
ncbi:hypothetical protein COK15_28240 [Bacillus cereus]|uniref:phage tail spike protein n=1 Tax=Bacillus cereus TaxID=1396 RepID=UPI000BF410D0|nr:phage tail spike protein [Bacillus cereus]PFQ72430.1 hypothetical protein COK15_28240 [Bacillus cereus]